MDDYISISMLNDFIFCPYSIYLHNMYMDTDKKLASQKDANVSVCKNNEIYLESNNQFVKMLL